VFSPNGLTVRVAVVCALGVGSVMSAGMGTPITAGVQAMLALGLGMNQNKMLETSVFELFR
jgi:hypothetical protein